MSKGEGNKASSFSHRRGSVLSTVSTHVDGLPAESTDSLCPMCTFAWTLIHFQVLAKLKLSKTASVPAKSLQAPDTLCLCSDEAQMLSC